MKSKFETVGEIKQGNTLFVYEHTSAFEAASELLHSSHGGMPVVDKNNRIVGVVSEEDLLRALRGLGSFDEMKVNEIMTQPPIVIEESASLEEASKIMEDSHIHRLPVVKNGTLAGTVTRHDLLRAWLGTGVGL